MKVWNIHRPTIHEHLWLWLTQDSFLIGRMDSYNTRRPYHLAVLKGKDVQTLDSEAIAFDTLDGYSGRLGVTVVTRKEARRQGKGEG
jgi:hypothetical protein